MLFRDSKIWYGGIFYVGNMDCHFIGGADEYSGSFQYGSYEAEQSLGFHRVGTAVSVPRVCDRMVFYRQGEYFGIVAGGAQIYAAGRSAWRIYHDYGDQEYGKSGAGAGNNAYCDRSVGGIVSGGAFRYVRCGQTAF